MQINHCLILAAGFGSRMGNIGKNLPKVLWPVFEKSLLELQVAYAKSLGISNIYINLHYMGEEIEAYCRERSIFEGVHFLWEKPEILDIGGAIHNLASRPEIKYKGRLLVLNADQFFYLTRDDFERFLTPHSKSPVVLFSYWVDSSLGYNALGLDEKRNLRQIINNKDIPPGSRVETYTGISFIDLSKLEKIPGKSNFFESVCTYSTKDIPAILLEKVDYWDFGTLKRYWETSFRILDTYRTRSTHPFLRFLVNEKALKTWKINLIRPAYHSKMANVINLMADEENRELGEVIIMNTSRPDKKEGKNIWWKDLSDEVK